MWIFWTIVLSVAAVLLLLYSLTGDSWQGIAGQLYAWCFLAIHLIIGINISEPTPIAIEVYQGKTTLEYKIIDGEVIYSCVVYKQK